MTLPSKCSVFRRASTSRPVSRGMDTSVIMRSGRSSLAASSKCCPSRTAPTTSKSASLRILARPSVTIAWSSARSTVWRRITLPAHQRQHQHDVPAPVHRDRGMHACSMTHFRLDGDRASGNPGALGDTHEPQPFPSLKVVHTEPTAVIGDRDLYRTALSAGWPYGTPDRGRALARPRLHLPHVRASG